MCIALATTFTIITIVVSTLQCAFPLDYVDYINVYSGFECFIHICLGVASLYAGTFMNFSLRKYVPVFYKSFKK